jgi:hypothetical protein
MTLTKKHFEALAEILKKHEASTELVKEIAQFCASENILFNMLKFMQAATGERFL